MTIPAGLLNQRILIKRDATGDRDRIPEEFGSEKYQHNADRSFTEDIDEFNRPRGIASFGDYLYIVVDDYAQVNKIPKVTAETGYERIANEIFLHANNDSPYDLTVIAEDDYWVVDRSSAPRVYRYTDGNTNGSFHLNALNQNPYGITHTQHHYYVSDTTDHKIYGYNRTNFQLDTRRTIDLHDDNSSPAGIFTDGEFLYVTDGADDHIYAYAYHLTSTERVPAEDLRLLDFFSPSQIAVSGLTIDDDYVYTLDISDSSETNVIAFSKPNELNKVYKANITRDIETSDRNPVGVFSSGSLRITIRKDSYTSLINKDTLIFYNDKNYRVEDINLRTNPPFNLLDLTASLYDED